MHHEDWSFLTIWGDEPDEDLDALYVVKGSPWRSYTLSGQAGLKDGREVP